MNPFIERTVKQARKTLVGRKVKDVQYMDEETVEEAGWSGAGAVIVFDDGSILHAMSDEEGNDVGVLVHIDTKNDTEMVLGRA